MVASPYLQTVAWGLTTTLELVLLFLLLRRRAATNYPVFTWYLISVILQSATIAELHRVTGFDKWIAWKLAWGTQAVVAIMRSLAIVELARKVVGAYSGIWLLGKRLLLFVGTGVLAYALVLSKGQWWWFILNGVRGFELAAAAAIVTMLLFGRFYSLPIRPLPRALAIGFCLYSASYVINYSVLEYATSNSLLERTAYQYEDFWNFLGIMTYMASLLVWMNAAFHYAASEDQVKPTTIPPELYGKLSSELNLRLHLLNRQLLLLLRAGERRP